MPVLFWVQHLLGTGHLKRAATLARAMAARGLRVVIASGGTPAPWLVGEGIELVQLPPVRASDLAFTSLLDEHDRPIDDDFRAMRRDRLLALFAELRPRVIMTEMFPFGRRAFRYELCAVARGGRAAPGRGRGACARCATSWCGSRTRQGYAWMLEQARAHFDRILVHTDPQLVPFALTFPHARALGERLVETGYVVEPLTAPTARGPRRGAGLGGRRPGWRGAARGGARGAAAVELARAAPGA